MLLVSNTVEYPTACTRLVRAAWRPIKPWTFTFPFFLLFSLILPFFTSAQQSGPNPPSQGTLGLEFPQPGEERQDLPEFQTEEPALKFELPPVTPQPEEKGKLSEIPQLFVKKINIIGNTLFSVADLAEVIAPYENRKITFEELQAARHALTLFYVERGYINSGAVIPDQKVKDGIINIRIIEGTLTDINVAGNKKLQTRYISDRLKLGAGPPLNINNLQNSLLILQQNPLIKRINAELSPGLISGESLLNVRIEEEIPYQIYAKFANDQSPSVGSEHGEMQFNHRNLLGHGDSFGARLGKTPGLFNYDINYAHPVNALDTTVKFQVRRDVATVIEEPFQDLDIVSKTDTLRAGVSHPFYKTISRELSLELAFERRSSTTYLLGEPYSFSESAKDGKTDVAVLRFIQSWTDRSRVQVIAARSSMNWGMDKFGATINNTGEDGRFLSWLGQFQWARRLEDSGSQFIFRTDVQLSIDSLLPIERFPIGGVNSVRGFRENRLVRDNGLNASLEFRYPVIRNHPILGEILLAPFVDYGRSWNAKGSTPDPDEIYSAGIGIRWNWSQKLQMQIYYGIPINDIERAGNNLQDYGIHFQIIVQAF